VLARRTQRGKPLARWECLFSKAPELKELWEIDRVIKNGRSEEPIGVEERLIDNSRSSTKLTRS
jgi:hypothetical protein